MNLFKKNVKRFFYNRFPNIKQEELYRIYKGIINVLIKRLVAGRPIIIDNFGTISLKYIGVHSIFNIFDKTVIKRHFLPTKFITDYYFNIYFKNKHIKDDIKNKSKIIFEKYKEEKNG